MNYKNALIEEILRFKNNPYTKSELLTISEFYVKQIHDDLILSRGGEIAKLNLELIRENQFD